MSYDWNLNSELVENLRVGIQLWFRLFFYEWYTNNNYSVDEK